MPFFYLKACRACNGDLVITDEGIKCLQCARFHSYSKPLPHQPPKRVLVRRREAKYAL